MQRTAVHSIPVYEVRPRNAHRGVDLISDALPFGRLWYTDPNAISSALGWLPCWRLPSAPLSFTFRLRDAIHFRS